MPFTRHGRANKRQQFTAAATSVASSDVYFSVGGQVLETYSGSQTRERNVFSPVYVNAILLRDKDTDSNGSLDQKVYFTSDANFNVTGLISAAGAILQHEVYTSYGEVQWTDASWTATGSDGYGLKNLFQGMRYDSTIGWYVTPNRLYRAPLAYWNRLDPAMADGLNWYAAFAGNPIKYRDPTGLLTDGQKQGIVFVISPLLWLLGNLGGCARSSTLV